MSARCLRCGAGSEWIEGAGRTRAKSSDNAAAIRGARLALEAAADMIRAEINERYPEGSAGRWGSVEAQIEHRIRSLSPESIVKEGK